MTMRWRYGDTKPVLAAVASATEIEIGDLVWLDNDTIKPASSFAWTTDEATTQAAFANAFLGVAEQCSRAGDTTPIRVATSGVFEFDCAATEFVIGDLVAPAKNASANKLESQKVKRVTDLTTAIGRAARQSNGSETTVYVSIASAVMGVGVDGNSTWSGSGA